MCAETVLAREQTVLLSLHSMKRVVLTLTPMLMLMLMMQPWPGCR